MQRIIATFVFLGLLHCCFGQNLIQKQNKEVPLNLLDYGKEDPITDWLSTKELSSGKSNTKVLSDGVIINSKKHFIQIKQPDMNQLVIMPQVQIDTNMHYHIQVIGEVKNE